ncbi:MAG: adenosylcobinamide-phosphate synthase CbiB [Pseudomonadota bacterium]
MTLFFALLLDWFFGDPPSVWSKLPHPVVLFGKLIDALDEQFNKPGRSEAEQRRNGVVAVLTLLAIGLGVGHGLQILFGIFGFIGWIAEIILVAVFIAQKSMIDHVRAVIRALDSSGIEDGRRAVSMIVGRDTSSLDQSGVLKAAIESLSENFSDGVVAPAFWYMILGLPGIFAYKAINTADSMIGHKSEKYLHFGRAVAVTDDTINWPAARLSALMIAAAAVWKYGLDRARRTLSGALQNAMVHRSPNAGWPEAAMAFALEITLGGPRRYGDQTVQESTLNASGRRKVNTKDVDAALSLFSLACFHLMGLALIVSLVK